MTHKDFLLAIISTLVLVCGICTVNCATSVKKDAYKSQESVHGKENYAFYALRSCHQVFREDKGEFFSPDYLCSNPPLWCNWTIQARPGKRIRLRLEDFTPPDTCHLKEDQIHLDESPGSGRHRTLEQCWQDAVYTSDSNTLYVVLLIGGSLLPTYRGFHARYHTFGPPGATPTALPTPSAPPPPPSKGHGRDRGRVAEDLSRVDGNNKPVMEKGVMDIAPTLSVTTDQPIITALTKAAGSNASLSSPSTPDRRAGETEGSGLLTEVDSTPTLNSEVTWKDTRRSLDSSGASEGFTDEYASKQTLVNSSSKEDLSQNPVSSPITDSPLKRMAPPEPGAVPTSPQFTPLSPVWDQSMPPGVSSVAPQATGESHTPLEAPTTTPPLVFAAPDETSTRSLRTLRGKDTSKEGHPLGDDSKLKKQEAGNARGRGKFGPISPLHVGRPPFGMEQGMDGSLTEKANSARYLRNASGLTHLPGEHLFEVSVEILMSPDINENWSHLMKSVMTSVQTMVQDKLKPLAVPKAITSIRIKRLSRGVLLILWLQFDEGLDSLQAQRILRMGLQGLQEQVVNTRGRRGQVSIASVFSEDVNECGTQLVLCDIHAECINHFGSYACRCNPGYEDRSRLGSGGTICVDPTGSSSSFSPTLLKGLYALCFLLAVFVVLLLCIVGVLYRRHHRGSFLVRCQSQSGCDDGNSATSQLPPPPPPIRRSKDGWGHPKDSCPSVDLPLLKFSPLAPSEGTKYIEQEEGDKL